MECQIQSKTYNITPKTLRKKQFKTAETFQTVQEGIIADSIIQMAVVHSQRDPARPQEAQVKVALQECKKFSHGATN